MNVIRTKRAARLCCCAVAAVLAGCAAQEPRPAKVMAMGAHTPVPAAAFPGEGGIWRLTDSEFKALGPLPVEPEPDASRLPRLPAEPQDYRTSYITPLPAMIFYGSRFGFAFGSPGYWPRYRLAPFPRYHPRALRFRHR